MVTSLTLCFTGTSKMQKSSNSKPEELDAMLTIKKSEKRIFFIAHSDLIKYLKLPIFWGGTSSVNI